MQENQTGLAEHPTSNTDTQKQSVNVKKEKGKLRYFWYLVALVSGVGLVVDLIVVTPEDFIPVIGWLDEGMLGTIFVFALDRLGIRIPILSRFLGGKKEPQKDE